MSFHQKRLNIAVYLGMLVVLLDQMTKWWILYQVRPPPGGVHVNPLLNLVLVENRGVTFGMLNQFDPQMTRYFLLGVAGVILALLGNWLWRTTSTVIALGLGLVIGGAIGNVIDRVRFGVVIDFLDFHYKDYHWYAFNVADSAIVVGVAILLLDGLLQKR